MSIPANRIIAPTVERNFGRFGDASGVPHLTDVQTRSYDRYLQLDVPFDKRTPTGLEGVLREIFPIEAYDKKSTLEYIKYDLGKPRYDPDECRQLRLTYGRPFRVWLRLRKADGTAVEEEVYLGDMPIMIGGGEFIINGAERVVVSQLHRSPGVDFVVTREADKDLHSCRIIPERGSWIEILLKEKYGIEPAAGGAVMMAGPAAGAAAAPAAEPTEFNVVLEAGFDAAKKIQIIKVVREITGQGLAEAKATVEGAPKNLKEGIDKKTAEDLKKKLEEVGAKVSVKPA